jgi:hypothetical protein
MDEKSQIPSRISVLKTEKRSSFLHPIYFYVKELLLILLPILTGP